MILMVMVGMVELILSLTSECDSLSTFIHANNGGETP